MSVKHLASRCGVKLLCTEPRSLAVWCIHLWITMNHNELESIHKMEDSQHMWPFVCLQYLSYVFFMFSQALFHITSTVRSVSSLSKLSCLAGHRGKCACYWRKKMWWGWQCHKCPTHWLMVQWKREDSKVPTANKVICISLRSVILHHLICFGLKCLT